MNADLSSPLDFNDLTPIEVPVQIKGRKYVLCEANAEAGAKYRNHAMSCTTFDSEGKPIGVKGLGDLQALLVSLCLYEEKVAQGGGIVRERVSLQFVNGLSERITKPLFERAKAISELGEDTDDSVEALEKELKKIEAKLLKAREKEAALKNEPSSTETASDSPQ